MALTNKLTAIADAIRGKTGKTDGLTLDQMVTEIAGIQVGGGSGGIEPTASFLTLHEISRTLASYPFKPKYKNELIVWNTKGEYKNNSGNTTPYAFLAWVINGKPVTNCAWISGAGQTTPWEDENYTFSARTASFALDESGNLTVSTGTWGFLGENNTCTIYEIPLPIGLEV